MGAMGSRTMKRRRTSGTTEVVRAAPAPANSRSYQPTPRCQWSLKKLWALWAWGHEHVRVLS
jgi:hypothetical protein